MATCKSFSDVAPSWNSVCFSVFADEWLPFSCLAFCSFFYSREINWSAVWKAAPLPPVQACDTLRVGFVCQCIAWRQTHTVSGRCNLALQSCFMQKQKTLHLYWLQWYEMSEKEHELTKQMETPCGQCIKSEHYRCYRLARWYMISCTIM